MSACNLVTLKLRWDVTPCRMVSSYQRFGSSTLHRNACIYHSTQRNIPGNKSLLTPLSLPQMSRVLHLFCVCVCVCMYVCMYVCIYRVSQEERAKLRECVPYVKLYRYNSKHLYPKLNGYGDNGQRKVWTSCISA